VFFKNYTCFTLPCRGLGLVGLALYLADWPTIVLQCFDTVSWVIWLINIVPDMTYNVFGGMLNPTQLSTPVSLSFVRAPALPGVPGKMSVKWHVSVWRWCANGSMGLRSDVKRSDVFSLRSLLVAEEKGWVQWMSLALVGDRNGIQT